MPSKPGDIVVPLKMVTLLPDCWLRKCSTHTFLWFTKTKPTINLMKNQHVFGFGLCTIKYVHVKFTSPWSRYWNGVRLGHWGPPEEMSLMVRLTLVHVALLWLGVEILLSFEALFGDDRLICYTVPPTVHYYALITHNITALWHSIHIVT